MAIVEPTRIMGVLNVTPDSFSDGGRHDRRDDALRHGLEMIGDGADIIDVGGESSRPGSAPVGVQQELDRVIPVIEALSAESDTLISIDTRKPEVMRAAAGAGAGFVNDIYALREPGAVETVAALDLPVCLMHMQGEPATMQQQPHYDDVVPDVCQFLEVRITICREAGIDASRIVVDPGIGFGKTLDHNLLLLNNLPLLRSLGCEILVGVSRKQTIGTLLNRDVYGRVHGSVGLAVQAALNGASIVRVHDVRATADALKMVHAVRMAGNQ